LVWAEKRPREYAQPIADKVTEVIREMLKDIPKELQGIVVDHVLNGLCVDWNLRKAKAERK